MGEEGAKGQGVRHGSLFSGIGGFDLAAEWMGWENLFHCEWNQFGQKVLKYYWPNAISYDDICKTDFTIWNGRIDILTGGFPCQPYSMAGKRQGTEDARHLWPEMLRAIRECQPTWIVGENVPGLINWSGGLVFEQVCADLKVKGTKYNRLYCHLQVSTLRTGEIGSGLLPIIATPNSRDWKGQTGHKNQKDLNRDVRNGLLKTPTKMDGEVTSGKKNPVSGDSGTLAQEIMSGYEPTMQKLGLLPTPRANESTESMETIMDRRERTGNGMMNFTAIANHMLPTPMASDCGDGDKVTGLENQDSLTKRAREQTGQTGQLSPLFVMSMMGFPESWLEI